MAVLKLYFKTNDDFLDEFSRVNRFISFDCYSIQQPKLVLHPSLTVLFINLNFVMNGAY